MPDETNDQTAPPIPYLLIREVGEGWDATTEATVFLAAPGAHPLSRLREAVYAFLRTPKGRACVAPLGTFTWGDALEHMEAVDWARGGITLFEIADSFTVDHDENLWTRRAASRAAVDDVDDREGAR